MVLIHSFSMKQTYWYVKVKTNKNKIKSFTAVNERRCPDIETRKLYLFCNLTAVAQW